MGEKKEMIDWEGVIKDQIPLFYWSTEKRPEKCKCGNLTGFERDVVSGKISFEINLTSLYEYCDFILDSDKEKYTIEESEYRACENWEEFKMFMGKTAKMKAVESYENISTVYFPESSNCWFDEWELFEPINGSKIIGVKI